MLDHLITNNRTPSESLHNALLLAIATANSRAWIEVAEKLAQSIPDATVEQIKANIEALLTDTADNAGE
jgi:hypothetical protein